MELHQWITRENLWFNGERISPNSIEGTSFLANFFEKKSRSATWFTSYVLDDMSDFLRYMEAQGMQVDPASPSPWSFDDVIGGLRAKFISRTFSRDVEHKFNSLQQRSVGGKRLSVDEIADCLRDLAPQMIECTAKQLKQRFIDALDTNIAAEVNETYAFEDPEVTFDQLK